DLLIWRMQSFYYMRSEFRYKEYEVVIITIRFRRDLLADLVGFGVAVATSGQFIQNFPDRTYISMIIPLMQEDKRAGESSRKGFYLYDDKRKASPDPELKKYIEKAREISGVTVDPKLSNLSEKDIIEMIFLPVVNEACRVLAEGIAVKAADLDIASVMGMGFPPYRGGVMFWADSLGSKYIYSRLEEWSKVYGGFFKPCAYMAERAASGASLFLCLVSHIIRSASVESAQLLLGNGSGSEPQAGSSNQLVRPPKFQELLIARPEVSKYLLA
ncbi:Peroxisomal fatty acid beta-oxidation multifunctional protein MFP2-like protein, partial [Drosera capensis]